MYNVAIFLGYAIGSFLGGFLFRQIGGRRTLRIYSGLATLSALVYIISYTLYTKRTTGKESSNSICWTIIFSDYENMRNFLFITDTRNKVEWKKHDDAQREYIIDEKCLHVSSYKHVSYVSS